MKSVETMEVSVISLATGIALGILMVALLSAGGGIGAYAVANGGIGGAVSGNHMARCGPANAECGQDHVTCAQGVQDGTRTSCSSMTMTAEQCQAVQNRMSGDMMSGGIASGSCH